MFNSFFYSHKFRYLIAGGANTIFGYLVGLLLYTLFIDRFHIITIGIIANIISISFAFLSYKLFVFRTNGNWLQEYIKCYLVYGGTAIASIFLIWYFVDYLGVRFWVSQIIITLGIIVISFFTHKSFTFKRDKLNDQAD